MPFAFLISTLCLFLAFPLSAAASAGISRIAASQEKLTFRISGQPVPLQLIELKPFETYRPRGNFPVVWRGKASDGKVEIARFDGPRDRMFSKFQLVDGAKNRPLGPAHYVDDLSALPRRNFEIPWPKEIKGLQVQMIDDAISLGVKYAALNIFVSSLIDWSGQQTEEVRTVDGKRIPFNMDVVRGFDKRIKKLTDAGINVTLIVLNSVPTHPDPNNPFIHPSTDLAHAPFHLGAFNTRDERGLRYYRAVLEFLADRYSRPDRKYGLVSGFIIGNEIQAHWEWYNIGRMPLDKFVEDYGIALRLADLAVRKVHAGLRVYVSMDHHWNSTVHDDPLRSFRGRDFLDRLNAWAKAGGNFPWGVAFHPYPDNIFDPRTWNDRHVVLSFDTPKITFKNIEVLPAFLRQPSLLFRGKLRRIILSEQGFNTPNGPDGEKLQAAGYAYAYYRISHIPDIKAFIYHRHVDHKYEGGLRLGLWTRKDDPHSACTPDRPKFIYHVFKAAGTSQWKQAFAFAKPIIGIKHWSEILPVPYSNIEATPDRTASQMIHVREEPTNTKE